MHFSREGTFIDSDIKFYSRLGCTVNRHKTKLKGISITVCDLKLFTKVTMRKDNQLSANKITRNSLMSLKHLKSTKGILEGMSGEVYNMQISN